MDKQNSREIIKPNEESKINRGFGNYSIAGIINNDNGPTSKTKEQSDNEHPSNVVSSSVSNINMSTNMTSNTNKVNLDEEGKLKVHLTASKATN